MTEGKLFRKGDRVRPREPRACCGEGRRVKEGRVIRVEGPLPYDPEWMLKGVGPIWGDRPPKRVCWYEVEYLCPRCRKKQSGMFFGPQLVPLR